MNSRVKMLFICLSSLTIGAFIYVLCRPETYISRLVFQMFNINMNYSVLPVFVSFYIPDFLWATALCSGLFTIWSLKVGNGWIWGIITFLYGVLWELLQLFSVVSGTADIIDVILYIMAAVVVVIINYFLKKREEK